MLKPGESKSIEVTVDRGPEFTANVILEMVYQHLGSMFGNPLPARHDDRRQEFQNVAGGRSD